MKAWGRWLDNNKWFALCTLFLGINIYGVLRLQPPVPPPPCTDVPAATNAPASPGPRLISVLQVDLDEEGQALLELKFTQVVSATVLAEYLQITDTAGNVCETKVMDRSAGVVMQVAVDADAGSALTVSVRKGFYSEHDPNPLAVTQDYRIDLEAGLTLTDFSLESPSFEEATIQARFSRPVDVASLRRALQIEPAVDINVEEKDLWWRGKVYEIRGKLEKGRNYKLIIAKGVKASAGNARLENDVTRSFFIPDAKADIRLRTEGRYVSPRGAMLLSLESVNVSAYTLKAARLPAHNLVQFAMREGGHYSSYYGNPGDQISIPGNEQSTVLTSAKNTVASHVARLRELLPEDPRGAWLVDVMIGDRELKEQRLLVVTDTGITAKQIGNELLIWANSIHTLDAVTGAVVQVWSPAGELIVEGRTDEMGLALISLAEDSAEPFLVSVANGTDLAFLSLRDTQLPSVAAAATISYLKDGVEAYVYTDRGVYRPGETAHVRAIVRARHLQTPAAFPVDLHTVRPDGRPHSSRQAMLSAVGTVEFEIPWADFDATGNYRLILKTPGSEQSIGETTVAVEDFVPPRMAVKAVTGKSGYSVNETGRLIISARYLYGAVAAGNPVTARMEAVPADFASTNFPDYVFGDPEKSMPPYSEKIGSGNLNQDGTAEFAVPFSSQWKPPSMLHGLLIGQVMEQGGRSVTDYARCDIHPYPFYIGLRDRSFRLLRPGDKGTLDVALAQTDGTARHGKLPLEVQLDRVQWSSVLSRDGQGRYHYQSVLRFTPVSRQTLETGEDGTAVYEAEIGSSGDYLLRVIDPQSGVSSSLRFYAGGDHDRWQSRSMERADRVELVWDKPRYLPGETATLTVKAPFPGKALLTIEQNRLLSSTVQTMTSNTARFEIPVTTNHTPNAHAMVSVIREVKPSSMQEVYRAVGSLPLLMSEVPLRLNVAISAPDTIRPQSRLELDLAVTGPEGKAQSAEIAVAVVDEGICMLTAFKTPDPVRFFNALRRYSGTTADLYAMLLPETDPEGALYSAQTGGDLEGQLRARLNPVKSRRFKPVALWQGGVQTDDKGHCHIALDIPEFSGSLRIMAVAVADGQFGSAERPVTVKRPLTVLSSLPRFVAPGDTCTMAVELVNAGDQDGRARLDIRCSGPVRIRPEGVVSVPVAAGGRAALTFTLEATDCAGTATIELNARLGDESVQETTELSVRRPSAAISIHGAVAVPAGASKTVVLPQDWLAGSATFSVQAGGIPSARIRGGLDFLLRYPYGCIEQTVSSAMPLLYLEDLQRQSNGTVYVEDPAPLVRRSMNRILSMQTGSGGFGWWPQATQVYEWGSIYALHFLAEAQRAGYPVPEFQFDNGLAFLRQLLARPVKSAGELDSREWRSDAALRAYACYVLALAGTPRHDWTERLREQTAFMTVDSRLHLVMALAAGGRRRDAFAELQALDSIPFADDRQNGDELTSPARTAAFILTAWMELAPDDARLPERLQRLESFMRNGCWMTTQENAAALVALARYIRHTASQASFFSGQIAQGGVLRHEVNSEGHSTPLVLPDGQPLTLTNHGPGTLYANWQAHGIPTADATTEEDSGIAIRRSYRNLQDRPVSADSVKQGELLIVRLEITPRRQPLDNLVIEDLLPAGFEIENANLKTSQLVPWAQEQSTLPVRHLDMRDDRILVFANPVHRSCVFFYAMRAVTPGRFTRPAAAVSAMYDPEIQSRHGGGFITVEAIQP